MKKQMLASFYTSVIFCLFSSLVFFFPPLLFEINLKNMRHINRISYIQRWVIGDPKSYFKHRMFTRPDISFLENGTVWNRDTVEGSRMIQLIPHPFKWMSFVVWKLPISKAEAVWSKFIFDIVVCRSHT